MKLLDSLSLSSWFSSSRLSDSTGSIDFDDEILFSVALDWGCSVDSVLFWEGATTDAKGRLMTTEGGWRCRCDLLLVDERGEGGRIGSGTKRGEAANWDGTVFVDNAEESATCFAFVADSRCCHFSFEWLWLDEATEGDRSAESFDGAELRFDGGESLAMLVGAVRLRSWDGEVITLRIDDEVLIAPLRIGAVEVDWGGEIDFVLKRLRNERRLDENCSTDRQGIITRADCFADHLLVIIVCLE